jgi:ComF family protein
VRATSAVWLGEEAREIVHHLKYQGYKKLAEVVALRIAHGAPLVPADATLIPIPLGAKRRFERGYNQAEEIALALSEIWSVPVERDVIRRLRETVSQTSLTPQERVRNVNAAFKAIRPVTTASNVAILVDDVFTTGATLAAAASALLDAGWNEVRAVTFARALTFAVRVESQR